MAQRDANSGEGELSRRDFVGNSVKGAAAVALAAPILTQPANAQGGGLPMRPLGKTGADVSVLCLGGWHIGFAAQQDEAEAIRIMHAAVDEGMTFFDNAWDYHDGYSEVVMGKALATDGKRDKVFLMTKGCDRDYAGAMRCIDESLKRLQTDYLDLWQFHEIRLRQRPRLGIRARRHPGGHRSQAGRQDPPHRLHRPPRSPHSPNHARQALRLGDRPATHQHDGRPVPQLPERDCSAVRRPGRWRHRHEKPSVAA